MAEALHPKEKPETRWCGCSFGCRSELVRNIFYSANSHGVMSLLLFKEGPVTGKSRMFFCDAADKKISLPWSIFVKTNIVKHNSLLSVV